MIQSYYKVEHRNAKYLHDGCYGHGGVPSIAYFEFNGIYLSAELNKLLSTLELGIHIPENNTVQLMNNTINIKSYVNDNEQILSFPLVPSHHEYPYASMPYEFHSEDPFGQLNYFGKLTGGTKIRKFIFGSNKTSYIWYKYIINLDLPDIENGIIEFPKIKINGKIFDGPNLKFQKQIQASIEGLNC